MVLQLARRSEDLPGTGEIRRMHLDAVHDGTFDEAIDARCAQQLLDDRPCLQVSGSDKGRANQFLIGVKIHGHGPARGPNADGRTSKV